MFRSINNSLEWIYYQRHLVMGYCIKSEKKKKKNIRIKREYRMNKF